MTDPVQDFEQHEVELWCEYIETILGFKGLETAVEAGDPEAIEQYRAAVTRALDLTRLIRAMTRH